MRGSPVFLKKRRARKAAYSGDGFGKDLHLAVLGVPFDPTGFQGKKRVIIADPHIVSRVKASSALADENGTGIDRLAVVALDAKAFAVAVAPVFTGSLSFFVCHGS